MRVAAYSIASFFQLLISFMYMICSKCMCNPQTLWNLSAPQQTQTGHHRLLQPIPRLHSLQEIFKVLNAMYVYSPNVSEADSAGEEE